MTNIRVTPEFPAGPSHPRLGPAIDELLVRKIESLNRQIGKIEHLPGQAGGVRILKNEIIVLQEQLSEIRALTRPG